MISASSATPRVSRGSGSSGYGHVLGEPKRNEYAPQNAPPTSSMSSRTRSAVNSWLCRLNIGATHNPNRWSGRVPARRGVAPALFRRRDGHVDERSAAQHLGGHRTADGGRAEQPV